MADRSQASVDPRTIMTSGSSTTAAGLTAAAVKENGQWTLEAGALVLANGGVCCIDEIDGLKASDSAALHEVMEQQTCSVAKAGMITTLHTKVSVFGTCNPKGNRRIDPRRSLNDQLGLPTPLLSRFDVILLLLDDMNPASDASIVDHVLRMRGLNVPGSNGVVDLTAAVDSADGQAGGSWDLERLKAYLRWCKENFHPKMSGEAKHALIAYYQARRALRADHVTVRFFESLVRLSQAHAKLMARDTVTVDDAVVAICLTDSSISIQDEGVFQVRSLVVVPLPIHPAGLFPQEFVLHVRANYSQIPPQLRLSEMGYCMNEDSPEVKAAELKRIIFNKLLQV